MFVYWLRGGASFIGSHLVDELKKKHFAINLVVSAVLVITLGFTKKLDKVSDMFASEQKRGCFIFL